MIRAVALALALAAASPARAEPLAAAASPPDDVRRTILVGPSGQVWQPDGEGGWTRTSAGGVSADVRGAVLAGDLVVAGKANPLFRHDGGAWYGLRLGERGKTLLGTGPRPAVAIGRQIFVRTGDSWKRIVSADRPVVALWAESDRKLYVATERAVLRLAGKKLVVHDPVVLTAIGGAPPLGLTAAGTVRDLASRAELAITVDGAPVVAERVATGAGGTPWILGRVGADRVLVRRGPSGWERRPPPPLADDDTIVHLAVDGAGRVLVATATGVVVADADGGWSRGRLTARLTAHPPGPGPARLP